MNDAELQMRHLLNLGAHVGELLRLHAGHLDEDAVRTLRLHRQILRAFRIQTLFQDGDGLLNGLRCDGLFRAVVRLALLKLDDKLAAALQVDAERNRQVLHRDDGEGGHEQNQRGADEALALVDDGADVKQKHQQNGCADQEGDDGGHVGGLVLKGKEGIRTQ